MLLTGCCRKEITASVRIPTDKIVEIRWPERDGEITNKMMIEDIRDLRMEVIKDNERKRELKELIDALNSQGK